MDDNLRTVRNYHRGNGTLRGGGIQKVNKPGPSLKAYKNKLDHRLGYCIPACLITIATILILFGFFHQGVHEELSNYITKVRSRLVEALPATTMTLPTTTVGRSSSTLASENNPETVTVSTTAFKVFDDPESCIGTYDVDKTKCLTTQELQDDWTLLHRSYIILWELAVLNIVVLALVLPLACLFNAKNFAGKPFKLFYRAVIIASLFFLFAQSLYLIKPLLTSSLYYPEIVQKLFVTKQPRDQELINHLESRYACQFHFNEALVKLNLQQPCLPRIMDSLLPPYAVVLLIVIDFLPFLFAIFLYAWDACIKDAALCQKARRRIEINYQSRPQSREDILKKAMAEPNYM